MAAAEGCLWLKNSKDSDHGQPGFGKPKDNRQHFCHELVSDIDSETQNCSHGVGVSFVGTFGTILGQRA
jgi:hypothetical protein